MYDSISAKLMCYAILFIALCYLVLGIEGARIPAAPIALTNIAGIISLVNRAGTMNSVSPSTREECYSPIKTPSNLIFTMIIQKLPF
jgi:hypothetical protein